MARCHVDVFPDVLPAGAVVGLEETVHHRVVVEVGVPQQFAQHVGAQFGEFAVGGSRHIVAFLINAPDVVFGKKPDIFLDDAEIGERAQEVAVVGGVIPDINPAADIFPAVEVGAKGGVVGASRVVERMREAAFDGTQADDDVVARDNVFRRLAGILIGEGIDGDVRIIVFDGVGDGVDETDHRAGVGTFIVVDRLAVVADAVVAVVVLGQGHNLRVGVRAQNLAHLLDDDAQRVGVGQAKLVRRADARFGAQGVILGVVGEVFVRRHDERRQGVGEPVGVAHVAALLFGQDAVDVPVLLVGDGIGDIPGAHPVGFAVFEIGFLHDVQVDRNLDILDGGYHNQVGGVPMAAEHFLQEGVDPVERAAFFSAGNDDFLPDGAYHQAFVAESGAVDGVQRAFSVGFADDDFPGLRGRRIGHDGDVGASDAQQMVMQRLRGQTLGRRAGGPAYNDVIAGAGFGQFHLDARVDGGRFGLGYERRQRGENNAAEEHDQRGDGRKQLLEKLEIRQLKHFLSLLRSLMLFNELYCVLT
ncbi:MAG: hypothetical protein BWY37_02054 [Firmicutes bacterium ADurb.Bin262]|nr:MAG: hypothetical protein BWY37_02054 [Firmicutes bacterium ADurb.Bin262]